MAFQRTRESKSQQINLHTANKIHGYNHSNQEKKRILFSTQQLSKADRFGESLRGTQLDGYFSKRNIKTDMQILYKQLDAVISNNIIRAKKIIRTS